MMYENITVKLTVRQRFCSLGINEAIRLKLGTTVYSTGEFS